MIYNYEADKEAAEPTIDIIFENYESRTIRRMICNLPAVKFGKTSAECRFFDDEGNLIHCTDLPYNILYFNIYLNQDSLLVTSSGEKIFFVSQDDDGIICFSLIENKQVCKISTHNVHRMWLYNDEKIFFHEIVNSSKGILKSVSVDGTNESEEILHYTTKLYHPDILRLSEQYLIIYIFGFIFLYDIQNNYILMSRKNYVDLKFPIYGSSMTQYKLHNIIATDKENVVLNLCYFCAGSGWINNNQTTCLTELTDGAELSKFGDRIPTTVITLQKAWNSLGK